MSAHRPIQATDGCAATAWLFAVPTPPTRTGLRLSTWVWHSPGSSPVRFFAHMAQGQRRPLLGSATQQPIVPLPLPSTCTPLSIAQVGPRVQLPPRKQRSDVPAPHLHGLAPLQEQHLRGAPVAQQDCRATGGSGCAERDEVPRLRHGHPPRAPRPAADTGAGPSRIKISRRMCRLGCPN